MSFFATVVMPASTLPAGEQFGFVLIAGAAMVAVSVIFALVSLAAKALHTVAGRRFATAAILALVVAVLLHAQSAHAAVLIECKDGYMDWYWWLCWCC